MSLAAATVHLTPAESRALGRFFAELIHWLGWGWGSVVFGGLVGGAYAACTAPGWWPRVQDWLGR